MTFESSQYIKLECEVDKSYNMLLDNKKVFIDVILQVPAVISVHTCLLHIYIVEYIVNISILQQ